MHPHSHKLSAGRGPTVTFTVPNNSANCAQIFQETMKREECGTCPGNCDYAEGFGGQKAVRRDDWRDRGHLKQNKRTDLYQVRTEEKTNGPSAVWCSLKLPRNTAQKSKPKSRFRGREGLA